MSELENIRDTCYVKVKSVNKMHAHHALPSPPILDISRRHMIRINNFAVTYNDFMSFEIWSNMASESIITDSEGSVFQVLEGVVYYVDP